MQQSKIVLGIVGSPNPEGRTNQLVLAALKGATEAGATTELIQLSEYVVEACKDCLPWVCADNCVLSASVCYAKKLFKASSLRQGAGFPVCTLPSRIEAR